MRPHALVHRGGEAFQRAHVDLHVEVPGVGQDGAVPHHRDVRRGDHVHRAGRGDEHLAERGGLRHGQHPETAQRGVQRPDRVDLGDDDPGAETQGSFGYAAAAGAEPRHHHDLARQQRVRGPQDAVDHRLPGPAGALDQALGRGVVGGDDREGQRALGRHPAQPDHAGGGRLAAAPDLLQQRRRPGVQRVDQVTAVVDDQVWAFGPLGPLGPLGQGLLDVLVVGLPVHPGPGEDGDPVPVRQRRGDVVLGGQRVGRGQGHVRSARAQQPDQHRRLRRDVQAGRYPKPVEGPLVGKAPHVAGQERNGPFGVADPDVAGRGQAGGGDVTGWTARTAWISNGNAPACTGRRPARRCSRPGPWSAR